ncbi:MAG: hypothetical protein GY942_19960 [Aestuariibacter sp.]|nr:hypothetical protein [Aestuariibacter sp.]
MLWWSTHDSPPETLFSSRYHPHLKLGKGGIGIVYHTADRLTVSAVASEALLLLTI